MERDYVERGTYTELRTETMSIAEGGTKIDETDDGSVEVLARRCRTACIRAEDVRSASPLTATPTLR